MEKTTRKIDEYTNRWYVVYTSAKTEEKVNKQLKQSGFETYLPLQVVVRVWDSRKRKVMLPVISRIVFVCLSENDIKKTSTLKGGSLLLQENEQYVSVSIEQMEAFRKAMEQVNKSVTFLSEKFSLDTLSSISANSAGEVRQVLSIEGMGVILMIVGDNRRFE